MSNIKPEIFKHRQGKIRGRVRGNNNRIIVTTEGYERKAGAENALGLLGISKRSINDLRR